MVVSSQAEMTLNTLLGQINYGLMEFSLEIRVSHVWIRVDAGLPIRTVFLM